MNFNWIGYILIGYVLYIYIYWISLEILMVLELFVFHTCYCKIEKIEIKQMHLTVNVDAFDHKNSLPKRKCKDIISNLLTEFLLAYKMFPTIASLYIHIPIFLSKEYKLLLN